MKRFPKSFDRKIRAMRGTLESLVLLEKNIARDKKFIKASFEPLFLYGEYSEVIDKVDWIVSPLLEFHFNELDAVFDLDKLGPESCERQKLVAVYRIGDEIYHIGSDACEYDCMVIYNSKDEEIHRYLYGDSPLGKSEFPIRFDQLGKKISIQLRNHINAIENVAIRVGLMLGVNFYFSNAGSRFEDCLFRERSAI